MPTVEQQRCTKMIRTACAKMFQTVFWIQKNKEARKATAVDWQLNIKVSLRPFATCKRSINALGFMDFYGGR